MELSSSVCILVRFSFLSTVFSILRFAKAKFDVALLPDVLQILSQRVGAQKILLT